MELENPTPLPAVLIRGIIDDTTLFGSLVVRATFELRDDGRTELSDEQPWQVSPGPWDGPHGKMPGDELFYRGGIDVFLFGHARAPRGRPVAKSSVSVRIGDTFAHTLAVSGRRVWQREGGRLVPSAPQPFTEIPLTLAEAFGGTDEWDKLAVPFPDNPAGTGFYLSEQAAVGRPLPAIEDPRQPVGAWSDRPEPMGVCVPPFPFGPRLSRTVEFEPETGQLKRIDPAFYNQSFPAMTAQAPVSPGSRVVISGMCEDGELAFSLPSARVAVTVTLGDKEIQADAPIDQVGIECDLRRMFVTYRYPFRYVMRPEEKRRCQIAFHP